MTVVPVPQAAAGGVTGSAHPLAAATARALWQLLRRAGRATAYQLLHLLSVVVRFCGVLLLSAMCAVSIVMTLVISVGVTLGVFVILSHVR